MSTLDDLCHDDSKCLHNFSLKIFGLKFEEKPDYKNLKLMLKEALLENTEYIDDFEVGKEIDFCETFNPKYKEVKSKIL